MYTTDQYEGMIAETVTHEGHNGDTVNAYFARPLGAGPFPAVALVHHRPGWDEWYKECARRFAYHGYLAICPDLYQRAGFGTPEDIAAKIRGEGGPTDDEVVGDMAGAIDYIRSLPYATGKVAVFGTCSGARHGYLVAGRLKNVDAHVHCWGGNTVQAELTPAQPVAPIDYTADIPCPVLGLFGEEDQSPTPDQVATLEAALKANGKDYEFFMYPGAGHGFFYYDRANYRQEQAMDGWSKIWPFLERTLG
jgi:carboxymethylenebutenolidase